ncbi:MAG: hypothetical protein AAF721_34115 [Myxococcota bacterium]
MRNDVLWLAMVIGAAALFAVGCTPNGSADDGAPEPLPPRVIKVEGEPERAAKPEGPAKPATVARGGSQTCWRGHCSIACPTGDRCRATCSGGGCDQRCEAGATCRFTCSGGGCAQTCDAGSDCHLTCSGGGCRRACDSTADCSTTCSGRGCAG